MHPIVISTIIGIATFILTIFSAIYLNQRHVDKLIEQMDKRIEARISEGTVRAEAKIDSARSELRAEIVILQKEVISLQSEVERIEQALFRPAQLGRGLEMMLG